MRQFLLCYHDFSVKNAVFAERQIQQISDVTGCPLSVAVIPQTKGSSFVDVETFRRRVTALENDGHEILLHGTRHLDDGRFHRNLWGQIALKLTANEAEFAGLGKEDSLFLLKESVKLLGKWRRALPRTFVPPAWYGNRYLKKQALSLFDGYEDRFAIYQRNGWKFSPALSFAGLPPMVLNLSLAFARTVLQTPCGVPRLVFHPVDFEMIGEGKILKLAKWAAARRERKSYAEIFAEALKEPFSVR